MEKDRGGGEIETERNGREKRCIGWGYDTCFYPNLEWIVRKSSMGQLSVAMDIFRKLKEKGGG